MDDDGGESEWSDDDSVMTSMPPEKMLSPEERLNAKGRRGFVARDLC